MNEDDMHPFVGVWRCRYWYPSDDHEDEDVSEHYVQAYQRGHELVLESVPTRSGAYIFIRLAVNGALATGNWEETTRPAGAFKGVTYSGAVQLLIGDDKRSMEGKWAGVGHDRQLKKARIYTGEWRMERVRQVPAEVLPL